MRVIAEVEEDQIERDFTSVPGLRVTCTRCLHEVAVFGTSQASAKRGAIMLRDECPNGGGNFYVTDWDG